MVYASGNEWRRHHEPDRPIWEPVKLTDFSGKRLEALDALRAELQEMFHEDMSDHALAMHAIVECLYSQATVNVQTAKLDTCRLATARLPEPARGRRRLTASRRDDLLIVVGQVWDAFTTPNFPLPPPPPPSEA